MPTDRPRQNIGHFALIMLFSIIAMSPAYFYGVPSGNDQAQHYQFAGTIYQSLTSGDLYPSFAAETNHGFGDYGLRFYPPLTYYVLAAVNALVQDWYIASLLAFTLVFFVGGIGVYLWARDEFERPQALIAAMLYVFAPYHLNEIYNNFLLAEFFATAIIPFCFLYLTRACRDGRWADIAGLSIAYSLLDLTHLPLTIICSLVMAIYTRLLLRRSDFVLIPKLVSAVVASVVMTSFYWSRWLSELDWITHSSPKYFGTTWDYRTNFLLLPDHFLKFGEDALNLWFADILLISTLLVVIPTVTYFIRKKVPATKFMIASTVVLGLAVIMTTPLSSFVWSNVGFLQKVQFPWRFLVVITAFVSVLAPVGIVKASDAMKAGTSRFAGVGLGIVLVGFFFTAAFATRGAVFVPREQLNGQLANNLSAEGCDCWWPMWAKREAFAQTEKIVANSRSVDIIGSSPTSQHFTVAAGERAIVTVASFYYPRWQATVNEANVPVEPTEYGAISIEVPGESADVKLTFVEPAYVGTAKIASFISWLAVLVFASILLIKSRRIVSVART